MQEKQNRAKGRLANILVVGGLALLALALILFSKVLFPPESQTREEIERQMAALSTPPPTDAPREIAPSPVTTPPPDTPSPDGKGGAEGAAQSEAYLFIILNNRVWGIEPLGEERDVTVDQGDGVVNVIHLLPDGFYMLSSTCDNQLCVSEGVVTVDNYQRRILGPSVLCLPHALDLELVVPSHTPDPNAPDI